MSQEPESRDVRNGARPTLTDDLSSRGVRLQHHLDRIPEVPLRSLAAPVAGNNQARAERFRKKNGVARLSSALAPQVVQIDKPDDGQAKFRFVVANGVTASQYRPGKLTLRRG